MGGWVGGRTGGNEGGRVGSREGERNESESGVRSEGSRKGRGRRCENQARIGRLPMLKRHVFARPWTAADHGPAARASMPAFESRHSMDGSNNGPIK